MRQTVVAALLLTGCASSWTHPEKGIRAHLDDDWSYCGKVSTAQLHGTEPWPDGVPKPRPASPERTAGESRGAI